MKNYNRGLHGYLPNLINEMETFDYTQVTQHNEYNKHKYNTSNTQQYNTHDTF